MTASARTVAGESYHLYNRGNHKEPIFHQTRDYERFLWALKDACDEYGVMVCAYCLMPNHFHALVQVTEGGSLAKAMQSACTSYAMYYNRAYGHVGHLFQGRYRVRRIENDLDLLGVTRYIHRNPREIADITTYKWSSYAAYADGFSNRFANTAEIVQIYRATYGHSYATFCQFVERSDLPGIPT